MPIKKMKLHFNKSIEIAKGVRHLQFYPQYNNSDVIDEGHFEFIPGQFVTLLFDHPEGIKRRSYSISTIPGDKTGIEFAISYLENGIASEALFNIDPNIGYVVNAIGPAGKLILKEEDTCKRYVLVGTGTGISPYRAMIPQIKKILKSKPDFSIDLIFGARKREDLFYIDDFLKLSDSEPRFNVHAQLSRMNKETDELFPYEHHGYAQESFKRLNLNHEQDIIYLCGNPKMIDDCFEILSNKDFSSTQIRREKYISSN